MIIFTLVIFFYQDRRGRPGETGCGKSSAALERIAIAKAAVLYPLMKVVCEIVIVAKTGRGKSSAALARIAIAKAAVLYPLTKVMPLTPAASP